MIKNTDKINPAVLPLLWSSDEAALAAAGNKKGNTVFLSSAAVAQSVSFSGLFNYTSEMV